MDSLKDRLKQILLRDKLISPQDLEKALQEQQKSGGELGKILVRLKFISEDTLSNALSESLGLPPINISRLKVDKSVIKLISKDVAMKYKIMPISLMGDNLTLAMADPLNIFTIDSVKTLTGYTITPIIGRTKEIDQAIQKYYFGEEEGESASDKLNKIIQDTKDTSDVEVVAEQAAAGEKGAVETLTDEAPIIKLTDTIIQQSVQAKASDVFIEPLENAVRVRYRVDGVIREIDRMNKVLCSPIVSRFKVISNLDISEHRLPQDGRFKTLLAGNREVDFRVSILPTALGEKVCLRVLDQEGTLLDLESLGFEPEALKRLKQCAAKPHGMILTCGPTGSGKTTTLYSILKLLNSPERNITTVEDPVEYQVKGINQVNIKANMGLTFAASLRSILRQDPDVILIGEIRDTETLDIAVKAALTGHLVLSSLHTTTAAGSVIRMMNMGIEPFLICSSVLAIVAQRLIRKVCPQCKEEYVITAEVAKKVGIARVSGNAKEVKAVRGKGCKTCFNSGYKGRLGITEILILSPEVKEVILARAGEVKIKEQARKEGMRTMREDGLIKALAGLTTIEEVLRVTANDE
jgi:type IV pilus assembly protein PilB